MAAESESAKIVLVIGRVVARAETRAALIEVALEHVHRSRREAGCLSHALHHDVEDPLRLVFVEQWRDRDALNAHFRVPESGAFVTALSELASEPPTMTITTSRQLW